MPTLYGSMPYDRGPEVPCVWCQKPTDVTFEPAGMPHLGMQPLHIGCAAALIRAYERMKHGQMLDGPTMLRLRHLSVPSLASGPGPAEPPA